MSSKTSPLPPKPLLLFVAHVLVLALLLGLWPTARDLYAAAFRASVAAAASRGEPPTLVVRPGSLRGESAVVTFIEEVEPGGQEPLWRLSFSSIHMGYWPTAVLFALLFATPMTARRRAWALLGGFVWVCTYAGARLVLDVVRARAELASGGEAAAEEGAILFLRSASEVMGSNIFEIAVVLLAWVVLANPQRVLEVGALSRAFGLRRGPPSST